MNVIAQVRSGAQTGVDIGALRAAKARGVATGGVMPKGFRTLAGLKPEWALEFGLSEHRKSGYPSRTRDNVVIADVTVRIAKNFMSRGERCTLAAVTKIGQLPLDIRVRRLAGVLTADSEDVVRTAEQLVQLSRSLNRPIIVNFAGNSEQGCAGIEALAERVVGVLLDCLKEVT